MNSKLRTGKAYHSDGTFYGYYTLERTQLGSLELSIKEPLDEPESLRTEEERMQYAFDKLVISMAFIAPDRKTLNQMINDKEIYIE